MKTYNLILFALLGLALVAYWLFRGGGGEDAKGAPVENFVMALAGNFEERKSALQNLERNWDERYPPMAVDTARFGNQITKRDLLRLLAKKTGQDLGPDWSNWLEWVWKQPARNSPEYAALKSHLYGQIDPKFRKYFSPQRKTTIRLDEILWGGVNQDGIPPLRHPKMVSPSDANYLRDSDVVFGLEINGDARAYPKRILAWHEMFVDTVGGTPIAGVYCTLCGTVVIYETKLDGEMHELGTSGFLYRSNKLMYDRATQSLWSTLKGEPVVGPLVGKGIKLRRRAVVTSNWGKWRGLHPESKVLSKKTGHQRDYSEGEAYRDYFATDKLMFPVPEHDPRLKNKDEILALLLPASRDKPLAVAAAFLARNPIHHQQWQGKELVILTDGSGANRVYEADKKLRFTKYDGDRKLEDDKQREWTLGEDKLVASDGVELPRVPAHRAFWFGWRAAFPTTELVK